MIKFCSGDIAQALALPTADPGSIPSTNCGPPEDFQEQALSTLGCDPKQIGKKRIESDGDRDGVRG